MEAEFTRKHLLFCKE